MRRAAWLAPLTGVLLASGCLVRSAYDEYCAETGQCPDGGDRDGEDGGRPGAADAGDGGLPSDGGNPLCLGLQAACTLGAPVGCCAGSHCQTTAGIVGFCEADNTSTPNACKALSVECQGDAECCDGRCEPPVSSATRVCQACQNAAGLACDSPTDCCPAAGFRCRVANAASSTCEPSGGMVSDGGTCFAPGVLCHPNDRCCELAGSMDFSNPCTAGVCPRSSMDFVADSSACVYGPADCNANQRCAYTSQAGGTCQSFTAGSQLPVGVSCIHHKECLSGFCDNGWGPGKWRCEMPPNSCHTLLTACGAGSPACCPSLNCDNGLCCAAPGTACSGDSECCAVGAAAGKCVNKICQMPLLSGTCAQVTRTLCQRQDGTLCRSPGAACGSGNPPACCNGSCNGGVCP